MGDQLKEKLLEIYTDGACEGNPGPGGWGAILIWGDNIREISGYEAHTTNNRMEMMAAIKALGLVNKSVKIKLYTDSQYLKRGITEWIKLWLHNNWNKGKVKNKDLWMELITLNNKYEIDWCWVRGHNGNKYNELADQLATNAIRSTNHE